MRVSEFMGNLKDKSTLMIFEKYIDLFMNKPIIENTKK